MALQGTFTTEWRTGTVTVTVDADDENALVARLERVCYHLERRERRESTPGDRWDALAAEVEPETDAVHLWMVWAAKSGATRQKPRLDEWRAWLISQNYPLLVCDAYCQDVRMHLGEGE